MEEPARIGKMLRETTQPHIDGLSSIGSAIGGLGRRCCRIAND
jgi:hypothetical protein